MICTDEQLIDLFPERGQPAESLVRLALVTALSSSKGCPTGKPPKRYAAVSIGTRVERSRFRLLGTERVPLAADRWQRRRTLAHRATEAVSGAGAGKGRRSATYRLNACLDGHPPAHPTRVGRRKRALCVERSGAGGAGLVGEHDAPLSGTNGMVGASIPPICRNPARIARAVPRADARYEALQQARSEQSSVPFAVRYRPSLDTESAISQAVRAFELRATRYLGLAKTHLQAVALVAALSICRCVDYLTGTGLRSTRISPFATLATLAFHQQNPAF